MPFVELLHDAAVPADAELVVVHAERPVAVAAAGLLDVAHEAAALEPFAQPLAADVLNEQGEGSRLHGCIED